MAKNIFIFFLIFQIKALAQSCHPNKSDNLSAIASVVCTNDSLQMIDHLKSQGFRCDSHSVNTLRRGTLCIGKINSYSQPVRIYVSPNFQKKSESLINLHFHGHRSDGIDSFQTLGNDLSGHGDYGARLVESKSTDLLVIPESTGKCLNYDTELNTAEKTKQFSLSLEQITGLKNPVYKLSAHSGGGRIVNKIILNQSLEGRIKAVGLFDSIYQEQAGVLKFLKTSPNNKATVVYLENGSTQKETSRFLTASSSLKSQLRIHALSPAKSSHMRIMNQGQFADFLEK